MRRKEYHENGQAKAIKDYFDKNGIVYKDVADKLGISSPTLSNMLSGRNPIGKGRATKLSNLYGFDLRFILSGEGDLFPKHPIHQEMRVTTNNGEIIQNAGEQQHGSKCPSVSELMDKVTELSAKLDAKEQENSWLRSMVENLSGAGK